MPVVYYMSGSNEFGPSDGGGENPTEVEGIICGISKAGDAIGYHDALEDSYGEGNVTLGGLKVVQLRALGDILRLRFDKDEAPLETVYVSLNNTTLAFAREKGQPRYNVEDAGAAKMFVDGQAIKVEDGVAPTGKAPGTDVDTLTPGLDEVDDEGGTIEPPSINKETKPAKKNKASKKK